MKKLILVFLMLITLVGCNVNTSSGETQIIAGVRDDEKYDDFNKWLFDEVHLQYTPTFIVIDKNNKIVYFNDGEVTIDSFKQILQDIENNTVELKEEVYKDNIGKEFFNVDFVKKGETTVVELVWTNCEHCEVQIKENNPAIIAEFKDLTFIEYFPLDTQEAVDAFVK